MRKTAKVCITEAIVISPCENEKNEKNDLRSDCCLLQGVCQHCRLLLEGHLACSRHLTPSPMLMPSAPPSVVTGDACAGT
eukprot:1154559-Pelagomonas_calceolata.AAC.6